MAVNVVTPAPAVVNGSGASISQAFSVPATSDCAVCHLTFDSTAAVSVSAITYAGAAMTSVGAPVDNTSNGPAVAHNFAQQFTRVAPTTGSNTLAVTFSVSTNDWYANVVGFIGVDQTTPVLAGSVVINGANDAADISGNYSKTIPSRTTGRSVTCVMPTSGGTVGSTNQTADGTFNGAGTNGMGDDHCTTAAASVTHAWVLTASNGGVFSGFTLAASVGTPTLVQHVSTGQETNNVGAAGRVASSRC